MGSLRLRLAYLKGQLGRTVSWIGGTIACEPRGIRVRVKESITSDIVSDLTRMIAMNVIPDKDLRSMVGKLNHAAGLLVQLRPFMETLWAALNKHSPTKPGCTWRKQILPALTFFLAFFTQEGAHLERFFTLEAFKRMGTVIEIGTDASPWGLGGWLSVGGRITEYFACPITADDIARYGHAIGCNKGQQLWECLAILVAIDLWQSMWTEQRINIVLKIKGDNVTALTLLIKMRPDNANMAIVARELALRLAKLSFPPDAVHTPGVSHKIADLLSRVYQPGKGMVLDDNAHPMLKGAVRRKVPNRDDSFYKALLHEPAYYKAEGDTWDSWH